ncbi:MAG: Hint domain-containing protein [Paracoccaceae bacterium]
MVARTFFAFDNDALLDNTTGNGIINNSATPDGRTFVYSSGDGVEVTLDDTAGDMDTFEDGAAAGHVITDGGGLVANGQTVESESVIELRALDVNGDEVGPTITIYVFSQGGVTGDVWGFSSDGELVDGTTYVKTGGSNAGSSVYDDFIACFAEGTRVKSRDGFVRVEDIEVGQMLWTQDAGYQPVKWTSSATVEGKGNFAPVVFAPGSVGNAEELIVSQQHRMWLSDPSLELLFDAPDIFVPAKHLVGLPGVELRPTEQITYCHFMFDKHHVVLANGALSESFFLGDSALSTLESNAKIELLSLFPSLREGIDSFGGTSAMTLNAKEAKVLRAALAA